MTLTREKSPPPLGREEDRALRPAGLHDFIGQDSLKDKLSVAIEAAKTRKEALDHILFSGPPGLGKTSLSAIVAREMGSTFHSTSAPAIARPKDLARLLTLLAEGDVLFLDEIHRLSSACEEILYPAMEDESIDFIIGEGVAAQSIKLRLKPFTLIGATTRSGMLSAPLKSRFGMELKLDFYETENLERIVQRSAQLLAIEIERAAAQEIAERARMTPRIANRLLRRLRDYATVAKKTKIEFSFAKSCLDKLGIDSLGLSELDRRILSLIIERYEGGPVGLNTIAALVDEEARTIAEDCEPFLLRIALLEKTPKGRVVGSKAYSHLNKKAGHLSSSSKKQDEHHKLPF